MKQVAIATGVGCAALLVLTMYIQAAPESQLASAISSIQNEELLTDCQAVHALSETTISRHQTLDINNSGAKDIIFFNPQDEACGNVGCTIHMCLNTSDGVVPLGFGYAATAIKPKATYTNNMRDFIISTEQADTLELTWDGQRYTMNN